MHHRARHPSCASPCRSHCRERESASWQRSWIFKRARMRPGIARICARQNTRRSGSGWRRPAWGCGSRNISVGFENWKARRPSIGGDHRRFDDVRSYREAVARLSLATVAAIALNAECLEEESGRLIATATWTALFRIAMQCQIIDDVVDYAEDLSAGLPSFLTASCVAAAGHGIDCQRGTVLCREPRAFIRQRRVSAAHGALCRHRGDDSSSFALPIGDIEVRISVRVEETCRRVGRRPGRR